MPLDGSSLAECVLPHCFALAEAVGSRISLIRVLERSRHFNRKDSVDAMGWYLSRQEASAYLENLADQFRKANLETNCEVLEGDAAQRALEFATSEKADLVVLSSHGLSGMGAWTVLTASSGRRRRSNISIFYIHT